MIGTNAVRRTHPKLFNVKQIQNIIRTDNLGYKTISDNLLGFEKIGSLPKTLKLARLGEGEVLKVLYRTGRGNFMTLAD